MTWLPTWKAEVNSPVSPSFLFISNFKFICPKHLKTLSLSSSFSSLFCCASLSTSSRRMQLLQPRRAQLLTRTTSAASEDDRVSLRLHRSVCIDFCRCQLQVLTPVHQIN
ncbi:hypothetical protein CsSME_00000889 [Camellia sinensis var. sinensis]